MALPELTSDGLLPPGDHDLTIEQLRRSYLVTGVGLDVAGWDVVWREHLVDNLEVFVRQLWDVGVDRVFVAGSFVTWRPRPGDIDGYFECEATRLAWIIVELSQLQPHLPWDWMHRPVDPSTGIPKPLMWHRYRVELFPHFTDYPAPTGIVDRYGNALFFPAAFRTDRDTLQPKGVVRIIR